MYVYINDGQNKLYMFMNSSIFLKIQINDIIFYSFFIGLNNKTIIKIKQFINKFFSFFFLVQKTYLAIFILVSSSLRLILALPSSILIPAFK